MRQAEATVSTPVVVSVATINLGNGLARDHRLIDALRAMQLDILALEELNRGQAGLLQRELADSYPHQFSFGDGYEGRGVLSRYPISHAEAIEISTGRPDSLVVIDIDGTPLTVLVGHPRPPKIRGRSVKLPFSSHRQVIRLADLAMAAAPAVLMGDFNMHPSSPVYGKLEQRGLVDAFAESGAGPQRTFPARMGNARRRHMRFRLRPVLRLDYIWHTPDIRSVATWVGEDVGSDHLPVVSRLAVPRGFETVAPESASAVDDDD